MEIKEVTEFSSDVADHVRRLIPQLSSSAGAPDDERVARVVRSDASHLLIAVETGHVVGMLTIAIFPVPTGIRAWIEDVVVDQAARGRGVGEALSDAALQVARRAGARSVGLTSRPSREAANRLYRRLGFTRRETNVYHYEIE